MDTSTRNREERRSRASTTDGLLGREGAPRSKAAVHAAAGLSVVAAAIHLWVMPGYFVDWWGYGAFFLFSALAQGLLGTLILRWPTSRPILLAGIAGNLTIITAYVVSSTWGMPFGPSVAHVEEPGILGMSATAAEVGVVIALVALLDGAYRRVTVNVLLLAGILLWALRLLGILP